MHPRVMAREWDKCSSSVEQNNGTTSMYHETMESPLSVSSRAGPNSESISNIVGILLDDSQQNPMIHPNGDGKKYTILHLEQPQRSNGMGKSNLTNIKRGDRSTKHETMI